MTKFYIAFSWAVAMLLLATGARLGWFDHDAATSLLLVMPLLAFATLQRGGACVLTARGA